ncbi:MAG TPA: UDP-3-O-(3-hydroxymyristoyl)glucosamine N-acyltransferase [Flavobacterium sp.]
MKFTAEQIAGILEGDIVGNPQAIVSRLSKIEEATEESLAFLSNPKYSNYIYSTGASVVIVNRNFIPEGEVATTMIKVDDAYSSFTKILEFYNQAKHSKSGIEQPSFIAESARYGINLFLGAFSYIGNNVTIGSNVKIHPNCYVGDNVSLGDNVIMFAGAKIFSETIVGNNCIFQAGCVVGGDGFGFAPNSDGTFQKIPQIGIVIIEDDVDVGSCTTIDRATMGSTIIRRGVKLDNQIQIAHNVEIGEHTVIAAQTGVAGSTKIGKNCMIGGQVGIAGHLVIGNNVRVQAQSGIGKNIADGETVQGSPSFNYSDYSKSYVHFRNLPKIVTDIEELKKQVIKKSDNG